MSVTAIEVNNVDFYYGEIPILLNVNLKVEEKDLLALIGPNGGGKTTLIKLILGIFNQKHGNIKIFGENNKHSRIPIGYVPQDTNVNKDFPITVRDIVLSGLLFYNKFKVRYSTEDKRLAQEALEKVGMKEYSNSRIGELSGGQRQRVLIARALVNKPKIFILDEPTSNIDSTGQQIVYDLLKELNKEITIVLVSHDVGVIQPYIKSIACVNQNVYYHKGSEIKHEMISEAYKCDLNLLTHDEHKNVNLFEIKAEK